MLAPKSTAGTLLLLLAATAYTANIPVQAELPPKNVVAAGPAAAPTTAAGATANVPDKAPNPGEINKVPGSVDAPVDGLDGKPHDGPGLYETKGKGTGDVGISGGTLHVDLKNPPLHTGEHEIVDIEDPKEGDERKVRHISSTWCGRVALILYV
jgi:hypothetical protein